MIAVLRGLFWIAESGAAGVGVASTAGSTASTAGSTLGNWCFGSAGIAFMRVLVLMIDSQY